jgi:pectin methylesterase-like acyl-CoA thioesterase
MSEGTAPELTAQQRSYLTQAMDIAADLDIVFEELAAVFDLLRPAT